MTLNDLGDQLMWKSNYSLTVVPRLDHGIHNERCSLTRKARLNFGFCRNDERVVTWKKMMTLIGAIFLLSGCGQSGPLYLPPENTTVQAKQTNAAAHAQTKTKSATKPTSSNISQPVIVQRNTVPTGPPSAY